MSTSDRRVWPPLMGVAVLIAVFMVPVAFMTLMLLNAATWTMWSPAEEPPIWLTALVVTVITGLLLVPGVVVGRVARLRRWWLVLVAVVAALGGAGSAALVAVTIGAEAAAVGAVPGLIGGALLGVALADRLGPGGPDVPIDPDRRRSVRSREDRLIAGVCGGWAHAHGWKPMRVRALAVLAAILAALVAQPLVLVLFVSYVFAWLTWPLEPAATSTPRAR